MIGTHTARYAGELPDLLNISEGAKLLSVHRNTLRNWTNKGMIKTYRLGSRGDRRFALEDLLEYLDRRSGRSNGATADANGNAQ